MMLVAAWTVALDFVVNGQQWMYLQVERVESAERLNMYTKNKWVSKENDNVLEWAMQTEVALDITGKNMGRFKERVVVCFWTI